MKLVNSMRECAAIVPDEKTAKIYRADKTLYLLVKPSGSRSWVQRVVIDGRRHNIGLGSFPVVSLEKARRRAFENRVKVADGENPLLDKRRAVMPTFKAAAESAHITLTPTFKSDQHTKDWMRILEKYAFPILADIRVDRITRQDVLRVLTPIWTDKAETAKRVRQRIRTVFTHCQGHGHVKENVAGVMIDGALPSMEKRKTDNFQALDFREMPDAVRLIDKDVVSLPARLCTLFLIHTAVRSKNAREATWNEIDFDAATWTIPGDKMKNGKVHRIPLSAPALAILEQARPLRNDSALIFPSVQNPSISMRGAALRYGLEKIGLWKRTTVHGFRTSFRTWAMERTDIPREVCEMALAHNVGTAVEQAYSRSDLLEKRTALMDQWAAFLQG